MLSTEEKKLRFSPDVRRYYRKDCKPDINSTKHQHAPDRTYSFAFNAIDASKNEIFVQYVADGNAARTLLADNQVDFAVVGEPAATAFKASLGCNAEMDMQKAYADCTGNTDNYPQAGLFVKNELSKDKAFIDALFVALKNSKNWITANPASVTEFAKTKLYESAVFPAASIPRCAIDAEKITEDGKNEVITFLSAVAGKDSQGNTVNWADLKNQLFV